MKHFFLSATLLIALHLTAIAQKWQGQIGTNLATLPGRSVELTSAWSSSLDQWALTANTGYTFGNHFYAYPGNYLCDCGLRDLNTTGAFVKLGIRADGLRLLKAGSRVGIPLGIALIGSQYRQEGTAVSFAGGENRYFPQSASGFVVGIGLTGALNIRISRRLNSDIGFQKYINLARRNDNLLSDAAITHLPGAGLVGGLSNQYGFQGIVTLNYQLH